MRVRHGFPVLFLVLLAVSGWAATLDLTPYAGQTVTVVVPGGEVVTPPPSTDPATKPIGDFDFGVSDVPSRVGQNYFIIAGNHQALTIGGKAYERAGDYQGRELWYGKGSGEIRLTGLDGTVYVGTTGETATSSGARSPLKYVGRTNGNRPTYYTNDGRRLAVGSQGRFQVGGVAKVFTARSRKGDVGIDWGDGTVVKNSETRSRGVAVLIPADYASNPPSGGWIEW